jgi:hypothetical protein
MGVQWGYSGDQFAQAAQGVVNKASLSTANVHHGRAHQAVLELVFFVHGFVFQPRTDHPDAGRLVGHAPLLSVQRDAGDVAFRDACDLLNMKRSHIQICHGCRSINIAVFDRRHAHRSTPRLFPVR